MTPLCEEIDNTSHNIILGDFNMKSITNFDHHYNTRAEWYMKNKYHLQQIVTDPTTNHNSALDLCVTNCALTYSLIWNYWSDHRILATTFSMCSYIIHTQKNSLVQSVLLLAWQKKIYKCIFHKNIFNQLNKWLDVNLVGDGIYSNVPDLTHNDLCISSQLTCIQYSRNDNNITSL